MTMEQGIMLLKVLHPRTRKIFVNPLDSLVLVVSSTKDKEEQ